MNNYGNRNDDRAVVRVNNVSKSFKLPHEKANSVKSLFINPFKKKTYEKQEVLKDVSLDIKQGEFFGIVGRNGSGKSTLLKLLAGIYDTDRGEVIVTGRLTPFIELGVGFNPELTGRENVFLNGALLGFNRREMLSMYEDIVEFAELEKFMDQKLKNYSSGMQVRLAFSIAIRARSEILVLDEVLAVGDYNFQQKCFEYFRELKKEGKTVILVSHDTNALQMFCTRAVLLEKGRIKGSGDINKILKLYAEQNLADQEKAALSKGETKNDLEVSSSKVKLLTVNLLDINNKEKKTFGPNDKIIINCKYKFNEEVAHPVFGVTIQSSQGGQPVFATNTLDKQAQTRIYKSGEVATVKFTVENRYDDGKYTISGAVASSDRSEVFVRFMSTKVFSSVGWNVTAKSRFYQDSDFSIE